MARGTQVQVRLSIEEKAILDGRARESGLSVSEFIRACALAGAVTPVGGPEESSPASPGSGSPVGVRDDVPAGPVEGESKLVTNRGGKPAEERRAPSVPASSGKRSFEPDFKK